MRYYEVVELAGGIFGSICSATFDQSLDELGLQALGLQHKFYLSQTPVPATIAVEVDYPCSTTDPGALLCTSDVVSTCPNGFGASCTANCSDPDLACAPPESSTDGWSYEQTDNAIVFNGGDTPALGSVVNVTYTLPGLE
jgi:hypothetical protein